MNHLIKTLKNTYWYRIYDDSDKQDFCCWITIGAVLGLVFLYIAYHIFY